MYKAIEKVRHINLGTETKPLHVTVVSEKVNPTRLKYKLAFCSPRDTFKKKVGVDVARNSEREFFIDVEEDDTFNDISFAIIVDIVKNRKYAPRTVERELTDIRNVLACL